MTAQNEALRALLRQAGPARLLRLAYLKAVRQVGRRPKITLNLALQGGGGLGAFSWGALDRLLQERTLPIGALSGASAGALNAAVFATGFMRGGRRGARQALKGFWTDVANAAALSNLFFSPMALRGAAEFWKGGFSDMARYGKAVGGGQLRALIARHVDVEALRSPAAPRLFISATNVLTARPRIFNNEELSLDALLASACLPALHKTVVIDGVPYWDGGFSANPALRPLLAEPANRTLLIRLIHAGANTAPETSTEIDAYMKSLLFAGPLENELAQLRARFEAAGAPVDEIDIGDHAPNARLGDQPIPRLVSDLFDKGGAAAEAYLTALSQRSGPPDREAARMQAAS